MKDCFGTTIEVGDELLSWQNLRQGFLSPIVRVIEIEGDVVTLEWPMSFIGISGITNKTRISQKSINSSYWQKSESPEDVWDKFNRFAFNTVINNAIIENELSMLKHYLRIRMNYLCKDLCISF